MALVLGDGFSYGKSRFACVPGLPFFFFFSLLVALLCSQSHRIRWSFAASPSSRSEPERGRATTAPAPSASIRLNLPPLLPFPTIACTLEYGANVRRDRDGPAVDPGPPALELTERRNQQPRLAHSCSFVRYSYSDSYFRQTSPPSCVCACACACACVCVWHWVVVCTRSNSLTYSLSVVERTTNVSPLHPEVERRILLSSSWGISIDRELRGQKKKRDKYRQRHWPRSQAWKSHALRTFHTYLLVHTYILIHTPHTYPYIPIHTYHTYIHTYNRYYSPPQGSSPPHPQTRPLTSRSVNPIVHQTFIIPHQAQPFQNLALPPLPGSPARLRLDIIIAAPTLIYILWCFCSVPENCTARRIT